MLCWLDNSACAGSEEGLCLSTRRLCLFINQLVLEDKQIVLLSDQHNSLGRTKTKISHIFFYSLFPAHLRFEYRNPLFPLLMSSQCIECYTEAKHWPFAHSFPFSPSFFSFRISPSLLLLSSTLPRHLFGGQLLLLSIKGLFCLPLSRNKNTRVKLGKDTVHESESSNNASATVSNP